jgi:hypothetical protein
MCGATSVDALIDVHVQPAHNGQNCFRLNLSQFLPRNPTAQPEKENPMSWNRIMRSA